MFWDRSPQSLRHRHGSARLRRTLGIAGLSLVLATGMAAAPTAASAVSSHPTVETRRGPGMVCGLAVTRNGAMLMCVRRAAYATSVCSVPAHPTPGAGTDD
jgi:hypothetical protein